MSYEPRSAPQSCGHSTTILVGWMVGFLPLRLLFRIWIL